MASQLINGVPRRLTYKTLLFYYLICGEFTTERVAVHRGMATSNTYVDTNNADGGFNGFSHFRANS